MHTAAAWALPVTQICLLVAIICNVLVWRSVNKVFKIQHGINDEVMKAILNLSQELTAVQHVLGMGAASNSFRPDA